MKYDVVIIGSGLGGLECAHLLSRSGRNVLLLERGAQPGGCMQSYKRHGQAYDTGLHYVGGLVEGQSLYAAFKLLGLLRLPWRRLDACFDRVTIGDRSFAFAQGYEAFVDTLAADFPSERAALRKYTEMLRLAGERQLDMLYATPLESTVFDQLFEVGAWQYLNATFHDPLLINVLSGTSLKMELRQESLPLFTFAHGNGGFIESSWRLKGDGSLLVDSLSQDICAFGGEIRCNAEVCELEEKDGRLVRAICADGEVYEGDLFISDVHPVLMCDMVKSDRLSKLYRRRIHRLENTFGMFTVSLRIKPQTLLYLNWNQYVYRQPNVWTFYQEDGPIGGVLISCRVPEGESEYVRQIDLLTPMLWEKCLPWIDTRVGRRGDDYQAMKERMADECIALAERVIPGLRDQIEERYTSTPLTYRDYTLTPDGSAYGVRKDYTSAITTMHSPRTPISNLLLTGQNLMLHGVHGVTMTSLFTCAEVLGRQWMWKLLNE